MCHEATSAHRLEYDYEILYHRVLVSTIKLLTRLDTMTGLLASSGLGSRVGLVTGWCD